MKLDLSGIWSICLEEVKDIDQICSEAYGAGLEIPGNFSGKITLPDSVSHGKLGRPNLSRETAWWRLMSLI